MNYENQYAQLQGSGAISGKSAGPSLRDMDALRYAATQQAQANSCLAETLPVREREVPRFFEENDKALIALERCVEELSLRLTPVLANRPSAVEARKECAEAGSELGNALRRNASRIHEVRYRLESILGCLEL